MSIVEKEAHRMAGHQGEEGLRLMHTCVEQAGVPIFLLDRQGAFSYVNHAACDVLGYDREELLSLHLWDINPDFPQAVFLAAWERLRDAGALSIETTHRRKDNSTLSVAVSAKHINFEGEEYIYTVARDLSDLRYDEGVRIAEVRRERDALIREVHHRIKNHLQGVIGLLHQHESEAPPVAAVLEEATGQIRAIAAVHGLYSHAATQDVRLCGILEAIAAAAPGPVTTHLGACQTADSACLMRVHDEEAVPLALVVNELVTNAVKHGTGEVWLEVTDLDEGAMITVGNRGGRLPEELDWEEGRGLGTGLRLVRRLLPHPGATLELTEEPAGVVARLTLAPSVVSFRQPIAPESSPAKYGY